MKQGPIVMRHAWGTAAGGSGGNGGDVSQQSETNQYGDNNSGKATCLRPQFSDPADGSAMLHDCSKAGVERQGAALAVVSCLQRPRRSRQMPTAAMVAMARLAW